MLHYPHSALNAQPFPKHPRKVERVARNTQLSWKLPLAILLSLAALFICVLYIHRTTVPLNHYEIGPSNDPERWRFELEDGTPLEPQDGRLPTEGTDTVVVCKTFLTDEVGDLPLMVVTSKSSDCAFFLDGQLIYAPSGRYRDGVFSDEMLSTASGQFGLPRMGEGKTLTMLVQFQGEENRLSRMPKLTLYPSAIHYYSQHTGPAAEDALPAGVYFAVALFVVGLFLVGLWRQRTDPGLLLLAFCALSMAFQRTISYSYGIMALFETPTITWFCSILPEAAMSWMLWYRLSKKIRRFVLLIPGAATAALLALFVIGLDNMNWVKQMNTMTAWVLPATLALTLLAAAVDAVRGNLLLRRFFRYMVWAVPAVAVGWGVSLLTDGKLAQSLKTAFSWLTVSNPTLHFLSILLCNLLLILYFVQAVLELLSSMASQDAELQVMALRERYAAENLEIMRQSQDETRRQHHELRHHIIVLEEMLVQEETGRAAEYLRLLSEQEATLPVGLYSDNTVINAIAGHYLNAAKREGIRVEADIRADGDLPLKDEELCVLLTNLLENALEACRAAEKNRERFITLMLRAADGHLHITCDNSTDAPAAVAPSGLIPTSKPDSPSHGYGIPAMREIVNQHFGRMDIGCQEGRFSVKITL